MKVVLKDIGSQNPVKNLELEIFGNSILINCTCDEDEEHAFYLEVKKYDLENAIKALEILNGSIKA